jgi:PAS domain-containing protein
MPITAILCASLAMLLLGLVLWAHQQPLIRALRSSESQTGEYRDLLYTTLSSIGDAVIATDVKGIITFLNPVAQQVSGWAGEAVGQPLDVVFAITSQYTGKIVENPVAVVLREGGHWTVAQRYRAEIQRRKGRARRQYIRPDLEPGGQVDRRGAGVSRSDGAE